MTCHNHTINHLKAFRGLRKQTDFCMITKLMFDKAKHLFCCSLSSNHLHLNMHLSTSQIYFKQRVRDTCCIVLCARTKYYLNHFFSSHTFQFCPLTKFNKSTLNVSQMFTMWRCQGNGSGWKMVLKCDMKGTFFHSWNLSVCCSKNELKVVCLVSAWNTFVLHATVYINTLVTEFRFWKCITVWQKCFHVSTNTLSHTSIPSELYVYVSETMILWTFFTLVIFASNQFHSTFGCWHYWLYTGN